MATTDIEKIDVPEEFAGHGPGRRMLLLLLTLRDRFEGAAPSVHALARSCAEERWEEVNGGIAIRKMIEYGWITVDPDHPDAISQGKGAAVLTDEGRQILDTASL